jgi:hypothetical protein
MMKGDKIMKAIKMLSVMAILLIAETSFGHLPMAEGEGSTNQFVSNLWQGNHNIQLSIGLLSDYGVENKVSAGGVVNIVSGDGFLGSIAYSYWAKDDLAFGLNVDVIGSEVSNSVSGSRVSSETSSVVSVLFGIKYQPSILVISKGVRPYLFASIGPCVGSATRSFTGMGLKTETYSETAVASHFGLGSNFVLSRLFVAGLSVGYYLATDFDRPIGPQKNYSSPEFTLSIGILLGGGKE